MYHIYDTITGKLIASVKNEPTDLANRIAYKFSAKTGIWHTGLLDFEPEPPLSILTKKQFFDRLQFSAFDKLSLAAKANDKASAYFDYLRTLEDIDLQSSEIQAFKTFLENNSVLTAQEITRIFGDG